MGCEEIVMKRNLCFSLLVFSALMGAASAWAFQPGPDIIRECSKCQAHLEEETTMSGNTFGAVFWTDGKEDAPMLPERPWLAKCPKCGSLLWIDEIPKLGEQWKWGGISKEEKEWPDSVAVLVPSGADFMGLLAEGNLPENKERYLRLHA
jgi:hypothetical protein